jgi:hypothetical protein
MAVKYGLIAEDVSDVLVIKTLAKKISGRNISADHFVGKGCGPIKKKVSGWCKAFQTKGCTQILLVHDRDRHDADKLRRELELVLDSAPQKRKVVVVPSEELEAWLLSDHHAVRVALNLKKALKEEHHPERIISPKEHLGTTVWRASEKKVSYINAVHNPLIAEHVDVGLIIRKCPSFELFAQFFKR